MTNIKFSFKKKKKKTSCVIFFFKLRQKNDSDHVSNLLFYFIFYILQFFSFINNFILKIFHAMASKKKKIFYVIDQLETQVAHKSLFNLVVNHISIFQR